MYFQPANIESDIFVFQKSVALMFLKSRIHHKLRFLGKKTEVLSHSRTRVSGTGSPVQDIKNTEMEKNIR